MNFLHGHPMRTAPIHGQATSVARAGATLRHAGAASAMLLALVASAGCETVSTETSDGRPMPPKTRRVEPAPESAPVNAMSVLYAPKPSDSDANGRPDRLVVTVYLFARPYPTPTWREGTFVITAYPIGGAGTPTVPGKHAIHEWRMSTRDLELGRFRDLIGEGYRFQISLLDDGGTDHISGNALDFTAAFEAGGGAAKVWSDGTRTISFDPISASQTSQ
ncbi:MAG: hypothetical protein U0625_00405 [Phycisphaerales bacterium]